MDTRQAAGWTPSTRWRDEGTTWVGTVDGETLATLRSPDEVLTWMRQQAASLHLDRAHPPLSDPSFGGDRGSTVKLMASQGRSVQFEHDGTLVRAEVRHG